MALIHFLKGLLTGSTHAPLRIRDWQEQLPLSLEIVFAVSTLASYGLDEAVFALDPVWLVVTFFGFTLTVLSS